MGRVDGLRRLMQAVRVFGVIVCTTFAGLAAAPALAQATLQGAPGGELKTFILPAKGRLTEIIVYADTKVNGIKFVYRPEHDFPDTAESPLFGSSTGTRQRYQVPRRAAVASGALTWNDSLSSISLDWVNDDPTETFGSEGAAKSPIAFEANSEIIGARVRADANRVYALAFDTRALPAPATNFTIAVPDSSPSPAPSGGDVFAGIDDVPFKFGGVWQTADGDAGRVSLVETGDAEKDGPNCILCGTYNTPAAIRVTPLDPTGRQIRIRFDRFPGQEAILTRQNEQRATGENIKGDAWMVIGGGMTAIFYRFDSDAADGDAEETIRLELTTIASHFVSGESSRVWTYERPRSMQVDAEEASQAKAEETVLESKDSINNNPYTTGSTVGAYAYLLNGYDGTMVDPMSPNAGLKNTIFRDPVATKWDISKYLSEAKIVPRGLTAVSRIQHKTKYSETAIGSESETHKEIGNSFGLEGGPKGATMGASYSKKTSEGVTRSKDEMLALGVSRSFNYALVLDKPDLRLAKSFKAWVTQYLMTPTATDAKFDDFVKTFGTHYANAVTYGGVAVATEKFTAERYMTWREENFSVNAEGDFGDKRTGSNAKVSGGYSESEGSRSSNLVSFKEKDFVAAGGIGGFNENNWSVTLQASIPVLFDLRPISEVISGLWFDRSDETLIAIRRRIDAAVERRFASMPPLNEKSTRPAAYRLETVALYCNSRGDEGEASVEVRGRGVLNYSDDKGGGSVEFLNIPGGSGFFNNLLSAPKDSANITCDDKTAYPVSRTAVLWTKADSQTRPSVSVEAGTMFEMDVGMTGNHDYFWLSIGEGKAGPTWVDGAPPKAPAWTTGELTFGGKNIQYGSPYAPTLRLTYRVQRIE